MVAKGNTDAWWWIDAIQMAMPSFAKLGVLENDTKYFDAMWGFYNSSRTQQGGACGTRKSACGTATCTTRPVCPAHLMAAPCPGPKPAPRPAPEAGTASGPDGGVTASPDGSTTIAFDARTDVRTDARADGRTDANTDGSIDVSVAPGPDSGSDASGDGGDGGTVVSDWSVKQTIVAGMTLPAQPKIRTSCPRAARTSTGRGAMAGSS